MVDARRTIDSVLATKYAKYINKWYFVNVKNGGYASNALQICHCCWTATKDCDAKGKKYVNFKSELVLLSKLKKQEKKKGK